MQISRRSFFKGCCGTAAALVGGNISGMAFGSPDRGTERDILVTVFLRGGIDGLSLIAPYGDANYISKRPGLRLRAPGQTRGALELERGFGLHPNAFFLHQLYNAGKLAVVVGSGSTDPSRSHFDSELSMERGTPGRRDVSTGWMARYLDTSGDTGGIIPVLATSNDLPSSLVGIEDLANVTSVGSFYYGGHWSQVEFQYPPLRDMYSGSHWIQSAGVEALDILDRITATDPGNYVPNLPPGNNNDPNYLRYPDGSWGDSLETIAQIIKLNMGLKLAAVDFGGWDTHENQGGDGQGYFANQAYNLSRGLAALYTDLDNSGFGDKLTIVVMSEFGRRLEENDSGGTDHGHGNNVLVISGAAVKGVHGQWNGLSNDALDEGKDVPVLNDYRQVLSEILNRRLKNPNMPTIFPRGPAYAPLGVVTGEDLPVPVVQVPAVSAPLAVAGVAAGVGIALAARERRIHEVQAAEPPAA